MTDKLTDGHLLNALDQIRNLKSEQITLRDQFAMAALTGLLAANWAPDRAATNAYRTADYMLAARKEKK
jgi:hypothetical protein